ncbi:MAG: L-threonylcarbamoyladenylate synthase, partial [Gammaproteobacteria bacterium]
MRHTLHLRADRPGDVERAVALLRDGRLVAVPTETVYGLAADARNEDAVADIFRAKGRPADHPLIVHIADAAAVDEWARDVPDAAWRLARRFWPGPLTLLLPKAPGVSARVTGGSPAIGLRVPDQATLLRVLAGLGSGVAAPSANPYRRLSPTTAQHVLAGLAGRIDAVLDDGPCTIGLESTIVDLSG